VEKTPRLFEFQDCVTHTRRQRRTKPISLARTTSDHARASHPRPPAHAQPPPQARAEASRPALPARLHPAAGAGQDPGGPRGAPRGRLQGSARARGLLVQGRLPDAVLQRLQDRHRSQQVNADDPRGLQERLGHVPGEALQRDGLVSLARLLHRRARAPVRPHAAHCPHLEGRHVQCGRPCQVPGPGYR
jgi:hypothetical protein